jgi:superfamily II DNA or RNA helicase
MNVWSSWTPDGALVEELDRQLERTLQSYKAHPALVTEHANHEETIRVGGYANRTLLELVQNAADAIAGSGESGEHHGRVEIVLDPDRGVLYCANAGRPFSKDGLRSITMAHISGKRGDEIGRFGLGFKSVLAVTEHPQVFSRSVSFEFNSPSARTRLAAVAPSARRLPILRTAVALDAVREISEDPILRELAEWASTVVRLPDARNLQRIRDEIENFATEFLLFVSAVRAVRLRVLGDDGLDVTHLSRDLGNGVLRIERPDGDGDEWLVENRMHAPSPAARKEVGEAVSRSEVKVTVALPRRQSHLRIGQFWSYFPLQDRTSASGLFNAPWSVNDDRTTLLRNDYNREILRTVAEAFVDLLPRVANADDPAAHLDYMPARGRARETLGFGDETLIAHVRATAARRALIPDANGSLRPSSDLRPLDFAVRFPPKVHEAWSQSPHTGDDVPHWRCYTTETRATRLRDLFVAGMDDDFAVDGGRDQLRALEKLPKRGLLAWLREWADGPDRVSAARALRTVLDFRSLESIEHAKVIPTSEGLKSLADRDLVFLNAEPGVRVDGAAFVEPEFLAQQGIEELLRKAGFRDMDPETVLNARMAALADEPSPAELETIWDAVLDVPVPIAVRILGHHREKVRVPTRDGGWKWPRGVIDIDGELGAELAPHLLDRNRCLPDVAHRLGVVREPVAQFAEEDEPLREQYRQWVLGHLNAGLGPGERPIERIDLDPAEGPGPFSVLLMLKDAGAPEALRERWTVRLVGFGDRPWLCDDLDSGRSFEVPSPVRWAVEQAGLVRTTRGFLPPQRAVHPSLIRFEGLLPLFRGDGRVANILGLPKDLDMVDAAVLREALESRVFPDSVDDATLVEFILTAVQVAFGNGHAPSSIPARVGRTLEPRAPDAVFVATSEDERAYLATRGRPHLVAVPEDRNRLVELVGCRRFEDSFAFSMVIEGEQAAEPVLDVFPGLRSSHVGEVLQNTMLARAAQIVKRVTTEDGVEDQALDSALVGLKLVLRDDLDEVRALREINDAFSLGLDNAELSRVIKAGLDLRLERLRAEARAAATDAERLEVYFGDDTLREALPTGLWTALRSQGLVDETTSVGDLFLAVYGTDAIATLREAFRDEGFADVPQQWAGGDATISWLRKMGFGPNYAGQRTRALEDEFVVPGAVRLKGLHDFQERIASGLRDVLLLRDSEGRAGKAMVELPTGAGKTRVACETVLRLFIEGALSGPVLWIAQSQELCEQAVQTWSTLWRWLGDERPLTIGRLWESHTVHEPETEFSVIVATDAKLEVVLGTAEYDWLKKVSAVIVDEAHRAGSSERYTRILDWFGVAGRGWERPLVGLSATPFKGGSAGTDALASRFGRRKLVAFDEDPYAQLVEKKVLARVEHQILPGVEVKLSRDELKDARALRKLPDSVMTRIARDEARMAALVDHICSLDRSWPVLVFTPTVLSAHVLAATLKYKGWAAAAVSGDTGRHRRREVIAEFNRGNIQVLTNCDLLTQGFDAPGVRALYVARPTLSPGAYIQMVGRGLRGPANGGKEECLIVDLVDNFGEINELLGYREYESYWQEPQP